MAEVAVVMTAQEASLWRAQQKLIAQTRELEGGLTKVGKAGQDAGKKGEAAAKGHSGAIDRLGKSVGNAVVSYVSFQAAIGLASRAMQFSNQQIDQATQSFDKLGDSRRRLTQVATGAEDLQKMEALADELAAKHGVEREVTRRVIFSARSEGFEDLVENIIANARVLHPESQASAAGQIPGLFKGAITSAQALEGAFAAANRSRLDFERLAIALPAASEGAAFAGAKPSETMALASVLPTEFKTGETAADRIKAIGTAIGLDKELAGKGIVEAVKQLEAGSERRRKDFLGTDRDLNVAYARVRDSMQMIEQRQRDVEQAIAKTGTAQAPLREAAAAAVDPRTKVGRLTQAAIDAQRARIELEISNERQLAEGGFRRQAAVDRAMAKLATEMNPFDQMMAEFRGWLGKSLRWSPQTIEQFVRPTYPVGSAGWEEAQRRTQTLRQTIQNVGEAGPAGSMSAPQLPGERQQLPTPTAVTAERRQIGSAISTEEPRHRQLGAPLVREGGAKIELGASDLVDAANDLKRAARDLSVAASRENTQRSSYSNAQRAQAAAVSP